MQLLLSWQKMSSSTSSVSPTSSAEKNQQQPLSFSIERILSADPPLPSFPPSGPSPPPFDWLYYTRYHPPRLPRTSAHNQPVKRTPGRLPRVPFTPQQLNALEAAYKKSMYLSAEEANLLAKRLDLSSVRVKIWYQNRRARERREKRNPNVQGKNLHFQSFHERNYGANYETTMEEFKIFNNGHHSSFDQERKES